MRWVLFLVAASLAAPAGANDWERNYVPARDQNRLIAYAGEPEMIRTKGSLDEDREDMWRKVFAPYGSSSFNTTNPRTKTARTFAKKLGARYVIAESQRAAAQSQQIP